MRTPRIVAPALLVALAGLAACTNPYDPGQRAVGGGVLGAGAGAALGAIAGGGRGAAIGALAGGALGAAGGAATTPVAPAYAPPPGYYPPQPGYGGGYAQPGYAPSGYAPPPPGYAPSGYAPPPSDGGYYGGYGRPEY